MLRMPKCAPASADETEFIKKYEYVMVFPLIEAKEAKHSTVQGVEYSTVHDNSGKESPECRYIIDVMKKKGLELFMYNSVQDDELYVLIHAPDDLLKTYADNIDYELRLDDAFLEKSLKEGDKDRKIAPIYITHDEAISKWRPYEHIYAKYESNPESVRQEMYLQPQDGKSYFFTNDRLKLLYYFLKGPEISGGCNFQLSHLLLKGTLKAFNPLHNHHKNKTLKEECTALGTLPWKQPIDDIRFYFGEKIALYNLFLGHYCHFLLIPAIVGCVFQLVVWGTGNFSHPVLPFFGIVISLWSLLVLVYWKRTEATNALRWGMTKFEQNEQVRPEFKGNVMKSFVDGSDMIYFPSQNLNQRLQFSFLIIGSLIMLVLGVVASIYYLRFSLQPNIGSNASTVASILNAVQIQVFNMIYQMVVRKLTDFENHRTDTQYQDSLIVKLFLFQFVNSYSSFFFIAFIAENLPPAAGTPSNFVGQCGYENCMQPLMINLVIIFGSRLVVNNVVALTVPRVMYLLNYNRETKGAEHKTLSLAEQEYLLLPYDPMGDNIANYADTAIEFGFMSLFITALPIACLFSLMNSYVKLRTNAYKQADLYRRPIPTAAQDIGSFQAIFELMAVATVLTNAGLICFTMTVVEQRGVTFAGKLWIFIGFQWVLFVIQYILSYLVPEKPDKVEIQIDRTEFITKKLILHEPDEDYDENAENKDDETQGAGEIEEEDHKHKGGCCCFGDNSVDDKTNKKLKKRMKEEGSKLSDYPPQKYPFA